MAIHQINSKYYKQNKSKANKYYGVSI